MQSLISRGSAFQILFCPFEKGFAKAKWSRSSIERPWVDAHRATWHELFSKRDVLWVRLSFVIAWFACCVHVTESTQYTWYLILVFNHLCYSDKDRFYHTRCYFVFLCSVPFYNTSCTLPVLFRVIIPPSEWFKWLSVFRRSVQNPSEP